MDKNKEPLLTALIPARAGSVGVPNKNFREYRNGKSLVELALAVARESGIFSNIVLSSDHSSAAKIAKDFGAIVHRRSFQAATSTATADQVLQDVSGLVSRLSEGVDVKKTFLFYLQPTSPNRTVDTLHQAKNLLLMGNESVASIYEVKIAGHKLVTVEDGRIQALVSGSHLTANRQDLPTSYLCDGNVFAFSWNKWLRDGRFPIEDARAIISNPDNALDIDSLADFEHEQGLS